MDSDHRRGMGVSRNFYHGQSRAANFARFFWVRFNFVIIVTT
jgi:hypothetical protein